VGGAQHVGHLGAHEAERIALALGLFGLVFSYFVNADAMRRLTAWGAEAADPAALAVQRRFLEKAIFRLLGPRQSRSRSVRRSRRVHG